MFILAGSLPKVMLSHMALYGLSAILEADGVSDVTLGWTGGPDPRPNVDGKALDHEVVADAVQRHAIAHAQESWVQRDIDINGKLRGLMSPRRSVFKDDNEWRKGQVARYKVLDDLTTRWVWLDLRLLAALGEPSYWNTNDKGQLQPDDGASRLEMQPRNQGADFVATRLRKLATVVASRSAEGLVSGLTGEDPKDEAENEKIDSRTPTGFASPGPTDNALAWCALWGIATFPIAMRVVEGSRSSRPAVTSGHAGRRYGECFYLPMWRGRWRPARLRSVTASRAMTIVAVANTEYANADRVGDQEVAAARAWLRPRHVEGLVRFPIDRFGSDNAPERRAMDGELVSLKVSQ
ncbi:MAG: hypothetical protein ACRCTR_09605 [Actinomycetota bacterium]